jgi:hypothetical protein
MRMLQVYFKKNYCYLGNFQLHKKKWRKIVEIHGYKVTIEDHKVRCLEELLQSEEQDASQMMNESLDVFCTINEEGNCVCKCCL